jgi:hypothetical protein
MPTTGATTSNCGMAIRFGRPSCVAGRRADGEGALVDGSPVDGTPVETVVRRGVAPAGVRPDDAFVEGLESEGDELGDDEAPARSPYCRYAPTAMTHTPASATAPLHRSGAGRPRRRAKLTSDAVPSASPECDDRSTGQHQSTGGQQQTAGQTERTVATRNRISAIAATHAGVDLCRHAGRRRTRLRR